jgi:hypothetical protein
MQIPQAANQMNELAILFEVKICRLVNWLGNEWHP